MAAMKVLNVAEKNDAAKHIAEVMARGRFNRRDGFSPYNKIYEFPYLLQGQQVNMVMTSVSGHLLGLEFPIQYKKWQSVHPLQLFDAPINKGCKEENSLKIKKTLEREVRGAKILIIWTDCDREGENIGMEVVSVCCSANSRLKVLRARFSEITRPSIERAIANLDSMNELVAAAVDCRSELDLRIGAAFTRFQTLRLQKLFPNTLADKLVSYGSCQFPTMGFVVARYKEIEEFVSEPFWKLKVTHEVEDTKVDFVWKRTRLFDEFIVQLYHEICTSQPLAHVEQCQSKPKSKWRPLPLDTVELQKLGNRKLKLPAQTVMATAEKLYTQGYISYPRTETNIFPKELNLSNLVQLQTQDSRWGAFAGRVLGEWGGPHPRAGKKNDEAHPPIHPTKPATNLQGNEARLYEFIVRHFLACVSRDAVGKETTVHIDISAEKFVGHGLTVIERNYLEVYIYERWSDKEILDYENIGSFEPTSIDVVAGHTEPPKLLTEADLITLMDRHGIGTDATQAEHIETIKNREYVFVEDGDKLVPGKLGMALVDGYDAMGLSMSKPIHRSTLEDDLRRICDGVKTKEEVLADQIRYYRSIFENSWANANKLDAATEFYLGEAPSQNATAAVLSNGDQGSDGGGIPGLDLPDPVVDCTACGESQLVLKKRQQAGSWMISCQGFPVCRSAIWLPNLVQEAKVEASRCRSCEGQPAKIRMTVKKGSLLPFYQDCFIGCLGGCDENLLQVLGISKLNGGRTSTSSGNSFSNTFPSGGSRGGSVDRGGSARGREQSGGSRGRGGTTRGGTSIGSIDRPRGMGSSRSRARGDGGGKKRGGTKRPWDMSDSGFMSGNSNQAISGCSNQSTSSYNSGNSSTSQPSNNFNNTPGSDGQLSCNCGTPAIILTVRKEGANQGRQFYKCEGGGCNFFQWEDQVAANSGFNEGGHSSHGGGRGHPPAAARGGHTSGGSNWSVPGGGNDAGGEASSGDVILCQCQMPSARRTTQKEGPNKGRDFFCCPRPFDEKCQFFQWCDAVDIQGLRQGGINSSQDTDDVPLSCNCGRPCAKRTVMKEGPNTGREFFCCANPRESQCGYFQWTDEAAGEGPSQTSNFGQYEGGGRNNGRGGTRGGRGGRGRGASSTSGPRNANSMGGDTLRKPRTCGICRNPGHTKKKCPFNDDMS